MRPARAFRMSVFAMGLSGLLAACAGANPAVQAVSALNLKELNPDPLECISISLRNDILVQEEVIHEPSFMQNRFMLVLRYREGGNEPEFSPSLMPGYTNVSLVAETEQKKGGPLMIHRRYCVIEMWRFYPDKGSKTCSLWQIGEEQVSMRVLLEDLRGRFISERSIALSEDQASRLRKFFVELWNNIGKRTRKAPPIS